jgi:hypothetical protein
LVAAGLLYSLRRIEHWLHQHIFKVGWLVTKQYQTTTILYYAFFLPGIILYELVFWLMAGFLNIRADRAIAWPQKQEIGELKLSFIKLSKNVGQFPLAVISTAPLIVGLAAVAFIANNKLDFQGFISTIGSGFLDDVTAAFGRLVSAPDFWIWIYLVFTISNTMWPDVSKLRGWRVILIALGVAAAVLIVIGAGNAVIVETLSGPVTNALNVFSGTLAVIIGIDVFVVVVLGTIEALIERFTGDSATFKNGKMITLSREELIKQRASERTTARQQKAASRTPAVASGPPSVYKLSLPIPGAPGKEAVTRDEGIIISKPPTPAIAAPATPTVARTQPSVIPGNVSDKTSTTSPTTEIKPASPGAPSSPSTPGLPARSGAPTSPAPTIRPPGSTTPSPSSPSTPTFGARPGVSTSPSGSPATQSSTPATPARPMGSPSTSPSSTPATPARPMGSPASPSSTPARPMGSPASPSSTPATPARPGISSPASPSASPFRPAPKPGAPSASSRSGLLDDDEDDIDDEEEIEDEDDDFEDDDLTYEDAEDLP